MDSPTPEHVEQASFLAKYGAVMGAFISGIFATVLAIFKSFGGRLKAIDERINNLSNKVDQKTEREDFNKAISHFNAEHLLTRQTMGKIFDQIRENEHRSQERFEKMMDAINNQPRSTN